jgi:hypothetical protein
LAVVGPALNDDVNAHVFDFEKGKSEAGTPTDLAITSPMIPQVSLKLD